jgi:hypothetical protein
MPQWEDTILQWFSKQFCFPLPLTTIFYLVTRTAQKILTRHISVQFLVHVSVVSCCLVGISILVYVPEVDSPVIQQVVQILTQQSVLVAAVVSSFIYCLVGRRNRISLHATRSTVRSCDAPVIYQAAVQILSHSKPSQFLCSCCCLFCLAGGIEHKFYTAFCGCCFIVCTRRGYSPVLYLNTIFHLQKFTSIA